MITVGCVKVGTKYGPEYVERLDSMLARHCPIEYRLICLTDDPKSVDVMTIDVSGYGLTGWWAKMTLFDPKLRGRGPWLYFDLDTVICGDIAPLALWTGEFGICENFTRLAGHPTWPCRYGSCVMAFAQGFGQGVFDRFMADRDALMEKAGKFGDQIVIEWLKPDARILQADMPDLFKSYRDLDDTGPGKSSVICFGGRHGPNNSEYEWVRNAWR